MLSYAPIGLSAMHHQHVELGAVMAESGGWLRPARYSSVEQELDQIQKAAGLVDTGPMGKLRVEGDEIEPLLTRVFGGLGPPEVGAVRRSHLDEGAIQQPLLLAYLANDEAMIVTEPGQAASLRQALELAADGCAHVVDLTSGMAGVRITGPLGHLLLGSVSDLDISGDAFPDMSCAQTKVAEVEGVVLRLDLADVVSYDLYFGREYGQYMWEALLEAGEEYGITPVGFEAMARLAAGD